MLKEQFNKKRKHCSHTEFVERSKRKTETKFLRADR